MSDLSDVVSDIPKPVSKSSWTSDRKAVLLRALIAASVVIGATTTLNGLRDAWAHGVPTHGQFGDAAQQIWGLLPYVLLLAISLFPVSKRSLLTILVATLLAWFMSTGYWNLDEMGLVVFVIPLIQMIFVAAALIVMFTFWLLRKRKPVGNQAINRSSL